MNDVAIIGAGPAGLTAAIYAARAGLSTAVYEGLLVGGQLTSIDQLENYPGFAQGISGFDIALEMREQAERFGATFVSDIITALEKTDEGFVLIGSSQTYEAKSVIVATGAKPRRFTHKDLSSLEGRGVSYCATCDGNFFRGRDVCIVGGGDTACADAIYLSHICTTVHLVHRRDQLRAHHWYAQKVESLPNVVIHWNSVLDDVVTADGSLAGVVIEGVNTHDKTTLDCAGLFVAIGTNPDTAWLSSLVDCDENGYIIASEGGKTNVEGLFVAGDVRSTPLRQVVTATSDGALAAEACVKYLAS